MRDLGELIREHRSYVRASLAQFGVRGSGLDDAEQEVFLVLLRRRDAFDPTSSYRAWLWGISRNVARAWRRREHDRRVAASNDSACSLEDRVHADQALAALDEDQRYVWLARVEGHTAQEIATSIRVPLTTVQWRIRTAKARLEAFVADAGRRCRSFVALFRGSVPTVSSTICGALMLAATPSTSEHVSPESREPTSIVLPQPEHRAFAAVPTAVAPHRLAPRGEVNEDAIEIFEEPAPPTRRARPRPKKGTVTPLDPVVMPSPPPVPLPR